MAAKKKDKYTKSKFKRYDGAILVLPQWVYDDAQPIIVKIKGVERTLPHGGLVPVGAKKSKAVQETIAATAPKVDEEL